MPEVNNSLLSLPLNSSAKTSLIPSVGLMGSAQAVSDVVNKSREAIKRWLRCRISGKTFKANE
jgi:hypothetical protein